MSMLEYLVSLLRVPDFDLDDALEFALSRWWLDHPSALWDDRHTYAEHVRMCQHRQ